MIRYIDVSQFACDVTFGWFLISWLITRHVLFVRVIISQITESKRLMPLAAYIGFASMLVSLQVCGPQVLFWIDNIRDCCRSFRLYGFGWFVGWLGVSLRVGGHQMIAVTMRGKPVYFVFQTSSYWYREIVRDESKEEWMLRPSSIYPAWRKYIPHGLQFANIWCL